MIILIACCFALLVIGIVDFCEWLVESIKLYLLKMKVNSWCREFHVNRCHVFDDHVPYMKVVMMLDNWFNTDCYQHNPCDLLPAWGIVESNINNCSYDQLNELRQFINPQTKNYF